MSSSSSALIRREKQLQELLEGKNFKQALNLCEKSIKKGDKSEQLLVSQNFQHEERILSLPVLVVDHENKYPSRTTRASSPEAGPTRAGRSPRKIRSDFRGFCSYCNRCCR